MLSLLLTALLTGVSASASAAAPVRLQAPTRRQTSPIVSLADFSPGFTANGFSLLVPQGVPSLVTGPVLTGPLVLPQAAVPAAIAIAPATEPSAQTKVEALQASLSVDGSIDPRLLEAAYTGIAPSLSPAQDLPGYREQRDTLMDLVGQGRYAEAYGLGDRMIAAIKASSLSEDEKQAKIMQVVSLRLSLYRYAPDARLYGSLGVPVKDLQRRVLAAVETDPSAYAGDVPPDEKTCLQAHSDCAVHQGYNHPLLAQVRRQMPYKTFLAAVEYFIKSRVRRHGMSDEESAAVFGKLGLELTSHKQPRSAEEVVALLRDHGALLSSLSIGGLHAVIVRGALREQGVWRFIVIDSNHKKPQVMTFDQLMLLGNGRMGSLAAKSDLTEPARAFYEENGTLRLRAKWARLLLKPLSSLVQSLTGLPTDVRLDRNLIPLDRNHAALQAFLDAGGILPPEAVVKAKDGKLYLNKTVLAKLLKS